MLDPGWVVLITLGGVLVVVVLLLLLLSGGNTRRIWLAHSAFHRILSDPATADKVEPLLGPPKSAIPPKPSGAPLRLLALLQRDGRLIDFLLEDIQAYPDPQIGAAVRDIHRGSQAVLKEHLLLEPVLPQSEGSEVEVPRGFDPSAIRVVGNVTGEPPYRGTLLHHGWRVKEIRLAPVPPGQDEFVLMPAEVELPGLPEAGRS
ncbi:MAG TPA: DUF2760 domain-containing protein [Gemmataceae bacterium]|nr:DUF2760 domain-containing protein [Gemmataceae bacterium]